MKHFSFGGQARMAVAVAALVWGAQANLRAAATIDPARIAEIEKYLPARTQGVGAPISDRAAWERLAQVPAFAAEIGEAEKFALEKDPKLPDELYLDYSRTGNRDRCQAVLFARGKRLAAFTIAECLENRGRFIAPLTDTIGVLCAEKTWVYPAHDGKLNNFYGRTVEMDLRATAVAWELAGTSYLLGDRLPAETRRLIRDNVERRVLRPFRDMVEGRRKEIHWMRGQNNWNAVCLAGITGAALTLEDARKDRAWSIAAAEYYAQYYLKGFPADGYCSEGLGYWNYGFGHFILMSETVRQNTGGKVDWLANPAAREPARFALRDEIIRGIYPTIADCSPGVKPDAKYARYVQEWFNDFSGVEVPRTIFEQPDRSVIGTVFFAFLPARLPVIPGPEAAEGSALRTWFPDGGLLICRDAAAEKATFGAALKGGNNGEQHNHNDVGSFSVVCGRKMLICDPGAEVYTARTFGPRRYESKVLNSYGHAVPVVAGQLQSTGPEARAVILRHEFSDNADVLAMDIRSAYAVPELKKLERTFTFRRGKPSLTVRDEVEFASAKTFETVLITWGQWKLVSANELGIRDGSSAVRVKIDTGGRAFDIRSEVLNEDVHTPTKPAHVGIVLKEPVEKAAVTLTIETAP